MLWSLIETAEVKVDLPELVDGIDTPVIVCYGFKHDKARMLEALKVTGKRVETAEDDSSFDRWDKGEVDVLVLHPASAGHGLNLQLGGAAHLFQYANTWNFETWDQIIRRIRRQGTSATRIRRYIPIMRDTTDEDRMFAMKHKNKGQTALFEALLARRGRK